MRFISIISLISVLFLYSAYTVKAQYPLNGVIISVPDSNETSVELLAGGSTAVEENIKSLKDNIISPGYQGSQESCVGWALGYCLLSYNKRVVNNWNYYKKSPILENKHVISPAFIYNYFRGGSKCDLGIDMLEALKLAKENGIPSWESCPYDTNECRKLSGSDFKTPVAKILSFNTIYNVDPRKYYGSQKPLINLRTIRQQISLNKPVLLTISVDKVFYNAKNHNWIPSDQQFIWKDILSDYNYASNFHAIVCIGYDLTRGLYEIINSWGNSWGNNGYCWITEDMMQKAVWQAFSTENAPDYIVSNNDQMIEVGSTKFKESTGDTLNFVQLNKKDFFNLNGYSISREDASRKSNYAIISIADTAKTDSAISTFLIKAGEYRLLKINNNLINIKGLDIDKKSGRLYLALTVEKNQQVKDYKIEF